MSFYAKKLSSSIEKSTALRSCWSCPSTLLKNVEGLPLAIVAIGGLLSTKGKDVLRWKSLRDSLSSQLESNPHTACFNRIPSVSFLDLPSHSKSYFLFLGIFPEDHSINCARLIRLWMAEGFVEGKQGLTFGEGCTRQIN